MCCDIFLILGKGSSHWYHFSFNFLLICADFHNLLSRKKLLRKKVSRFREFSAKSRKFVPAKSAKSSHSRKFVPAKNTKRSHLRNWILTSESFIKCFSSIRGHPWMLSCKKSQNINPSSPCHATVTYYLKTSPSPCWTSRQVQLHLLLFLTPVLTPSVPWRPNNHYPDRESRFFWTSQYIAIMIKGQTQCALCRRESSQPLQCWFLDYSRITDENRF